MKVSDMLGQLLSSVKVDNDVKNFENSRRKHARRDHDQCISMVGSKPYPVIDWSQGGLQIMGDERRFGLNEEHDVVLKFKLSNNIVEIPHIAKVVRKSRDRIAFQFAPLTKKMKDDFSHVIDDCAAREFADSQAAS